MARTPKLRINFEADVAYLLRLKQAVEDDEEWPQEWKDRAIPLIGDLALFLMNKPAKVKKKPGDGQAA